MQGPAEIRRRVISTRRHSRWPPIGTGSGTRPADPTLLGLIRILTGLMLLYTHAVWGLALRDFFSSTAWLTPVARPAHPGKPVRLFLLVSGARRMDLAGLRASRWSSSPSSRIGLFTRVTSILALVAAVSYANRVPPALFGLDQINVMLTLYLAIGPSGAAFSLDRWLARRRSARRPAGPKCRRQPGDPLDPGTHVRDLFLRGRLEAARPVMVGPARRCGGPSPILNISRST